MIGDGFVQKDTQDDKPSQDKAPPPRTEPQSFAKSPTNRSKRLSFHGSYTIAQPVPPLSEKFAQLEICRSSSEIAARRKSLPATERVVSTMLSPNRNKIVTIKEAIEIDDVEWLKMHLQYIDEINGFINEPPIRRPFIIHAFLSNSLKSFIYLLENNADLSLPDQDGDIFYHLNALKDTKLPFLIKVREELIRSINFEKLGAQKCEFDALVANFNQLWDRNFKKEALAASTYSAWNFPEIVRQMNNDDLLQVVVKHPNQFADLFQLLEILLTSPPSSAAEIADFVVGIMAEYAALGHWIPLLILQLLSNIYASLSESQKMIALFIIKELIVSDNFNYSFRCQGPTRESTSKIGRQYVYFEVQLKQLSTIAPTTNEQEMIQRLQTILSAITRIASPSLTSFFQISRILMHYGSLSGMISFEKELTSILMPNLRQSFKNAIPFLRKNLRDIAILIANDLRAFSLNFYQQVSAQSFLAYKASQAQAPSSYIQFHIQFCNKICYFFMEKILATSNQDEAKNALTLCIYILKELLEDSHPSPKNSPTLNGHTNTESPRYDRSPTRTTPLPDLNFAFLFSGILNSAPISRLTTLFASLSAEVLLLKDNLLQKVNGDRNMANHRKLIEDHAVLPYPGIYITDLSKITEVHTTLLNRCLVRGRILRHLFHRQSVARSKFLPFRTDLLNFILSYTPPSEEILMKLSYRLELKVFSLSAPWDLERIIELKENINYYHERKIALSLRNANNDIVSGKPALDCLCTMLTEQVSIDIINKNEALKILMLAIKAVQCQEPIDVKSYQQRIEFVGIADPMASHSRILTQYENGRLPTGNGKLTKQPQNEKDIKKSPIDQNNTF